MAYAKRKKRTGFTGGIGILLIAVIVGIAAYMLFTGTRKLKTEVHEYEAREEILMQKIEEEENRTDDLNEQKKYVKTDKYIEEVARDKLGLINPNEVLFKENKKK